MPWYFFKRGGWGIAVDAVSLQDAKHHISIYAMGAEYRGTWDPPTMANPSTDTAMTTSRRQEEISNHLRRLE